MGVPLNLGQVWTSLTSPLPYFHIIRMCIRVSDFFTVSLLKTQPISYSSWYLYHLVKYPANNKCSVNICYWGRRDGRKEQRNKGNNKIPQTTNRFKLNLMVYVTYHDGLVRVIRRSTVDGIFHFYRNIYYLPLAFLFSCFYSLNHVKL